MAKRVDSLALCNAQLHLQTAYKTFPDPIVGFPKFKSKKNPVKSYTTNSVKWKYPVKRWETEAPKGRLDPDPAAS